MAKVKQQPVSVWPWGGPGVVNERKVGIDEVERKSRRGNPKAPALASRALLESLGPFLSSEEFRLSWPPPPPGHDADVEASLDRPYLASVAERSSPEQGRSLERALGKVNASPERLERMRALLGREAQMLQKVNAISKDMREILRLMWDAQKDENF